MKENYDLDIMIWLFKQSFAIVQQNCVLNNPKSSWTFYLMKKLISTHTFKQQR